MLLKISGPVSDGKYARMKYGMTTLEETTELARLVWEMLEAFDEYWQSLCVATCW